MIDTSEHVDSQEPISEQSDDPTCESCGAILRQVSNVGGWACWGCKTFYAPENFDEKWTVVEP